MTCKELYDFLDRFVADELDPEVRASFEKHVGDCPPCADYLDGYRKTIEIGRGTLCVDDEPPEEMPDGLVQAILKSVKR